MSAVILLGNCSTNPIYSGCLFSSCPPPTRPPPLPTYPCLSDTCLIPALWVNTAARDASCRSFAFAPFFLCREKLDPARKCAQIRSAAAVPERPAHAASFARPLITLLCHSSPALVPRRVSESAGWRRRKLATVSTQGSCAGTNPMLNLRLDKHGGFPSPLGFGPRLANTSDWQLHPLSLC